jgi:GntR family transcriptional repressor for pyruvate dehydrogenase complex
MNHELRTGIVLLSIKGQRDIQAVQIHWNQFQSFADICGSSHNSLDTFAMISLAYDSMADGLTISLSSVNNPADIVKWILMRPRTPELQALTVEAMKPVVRTSLSDEIVQQIIDLISREVLRPGDRLPSERELCKRFGVGRTSLREALRSLAVMGILDGRVGEGTFVSPSNSKYLAKGLQWGLLLDHKKVQDLIETRLMLESQTSYLAAQRASKASLQEIEQAIQQMAKHLDQPEKYLEADLQFHLAIARATENSILFNLLSMTRGYLQEWIKESLAESRISRRELRAKLSVREHKRILEALRKGHAEGARQAMTDHILSSGTGLQKHIK